MNYSNPYMVSYDSYYSQPPPGIFREKSELDHFLGAMYGSPVTTRRVSNLMATEDGIEEKRIANAEAVANLTGNLICIICTKIVWKPISCSKCQNIFCRSCLENWKKIQKDLILKCPNGCSPLEEKKNSPSL